MNTITLKAPAKVNLFLKVLNKRKDGYHNIVTLFERISLADKITISKIPSGVKLETDKFITAKPEDNLAYKAAALILKSGKANRGLRGKYKGVRIRVRKRIPLAAGLGGGSSDAASILLGINKLYNIGLAKKELSGLAVKLGADVPFFILEKPFAIGRGLGERLEEVKIGFGLWHVIAYHPSKASTRSIYEAFDASSKCLTEDFSDDKIAQSLLRTIDFNVLEDMLYNSLEETALVKLPVAGNISERLAYSTGRRTILAGSGPSVFCLCRTRKEAIEAKDKFLGSVPARMKKGWQVFIAKTQI